MIARIGFLCGFAAVATAAAVHAQPVPQATSGNGTGDARSTTSVSTSPPPASAPDTIMFSVDELTEIRSRASVGESGDQGPSPGASVESATLYLSTIVYYGPNEWTIWVNGVPIGPKQEFEAFHVGQINPRFVELMVPLSAMGMRPVRLSPNQTFVVKTGAVVEGVWR